MGKDEELKEETKEIVVDDVIKENQEVEEEKIEDNNIKPKKNKKWLIILLSIIIVALVLTIIFVLINKNSNKEENKKDDKPVEDKKEEEQKPVEPTEEKPIEEPKKEEKKDDVEYIDLNVKNINSNKNYNIQLLKKYDKNHGKYEDGYTYAFYDKTNDKMLSEFDYVNLTCDIKCTENPTAYGCVEKTVKVYSFNSGANDYIYVTYGVNVCGGLESIYFIYDTSKNRIVLEGRGGTDKVRLLDNNIVINYSTAGDDTCGYRGTEVFICSGTTGYIIYNGSKFDIIEGKGTVDLDNQYAVVEYNPNLNSNSFAINIYNGSGETDKVIKNCIAYNDKYIVVFEGDKLIVKDFKDNKVGTVDSVPYDSTKYDYLPIISEENGKYTLTYSLKTNEVGYSSAELNLK